MAMMCVQCSLDFASDADYGLHKSGGHVDKSKGTPIIGPGVEPPADFVDAVNRIEAKKNETPTPPQRPKLPDPTPVSLTYKYIGEHDCRTPVETLELDVDKKHFAIAFCSRCKTQVMSSEVADLTAKEKQSIVT